MKDNNKSDHISIFSNKFEHFPHLNDIKIRTIVEEFAHEYRHTIQFEDQVHFTLQIHQIAISV